MERRTVQYYHIVLEMLHVEMDTMPAPNTSVAAATHGRPCIVKLAYSLSGTVYTFTVLLDFRDVHIGAFLKVFGPTVS